MASFEWVMKPSPQNAKRGSGANRDGFVEYEIAKATKTQAAVVRVARGIEGRATANLQKHRDTGASHISYDKGDIDAYIVLEDRSKKPVAHIIELETNALTEAAKLPRLKRNGA